MDFKWTPGGVPLGWDGLPGQVDGLEEALQNAAMALHPDLGSGLSQLDPNEENSSQRAWALAEEALMRFTGYRVTEVSYDSDAGMWHFAVETPLGAGYVTVPGKEKTDGEL